MFGGVVAHYLKFVLLIAVFVIGLLISFFTLQVGVTCTSFSRDPDSFLHSGSALLLFFLASLFMVQSTKCFFLLRCCGGASNHFCRKYFLNICLNGYMAKINQINFRKTFSLKIIFS